MRQTKLLVGEAAKRLGISVSGVRWLTDVGRIRCVRTSGGVRLLSARDVERLVAERLARKKTRGAEASGRS